MFKNSDFSETTCTLHTCIHFFSVLAFVEATKYLLENGVQYILSQVFNQDPLEEHSRRQRGMGRRCDNPNLWTFGQVYFKWLNNVSITLEWHISEKELVKENTILM